MKLFEYNSVLTLALILLALVVLVDFAGQIIRGRVLAPLGAGRAPSDEDNAERQDAFCRPSTGGV